MRPTGEMTAPTDDGEIVEAADYSKTAPAVAALGG